MQRSSLALLLGRLLPLAAVGQNPSDHARHNRAVFAPLDLPAASTLRTASGRPGPSYWQQQADYTIEVSLDPNTHRVSGTVTIAYTNNSPEPLSHLWLQLDQNLFRTDSRGAALQGGHSRWSGAFEAGGYEISNVALIRHGDHSEPEYLIDDTRMRVSLDPPLPTGGSRLDLSIDFGFTVPEYGADRMGRLPIERGMVYELAQWFPRMYVFDDTNGWNTQPYLGQGEFYLNYGSYRVEITLPSDFVVVATGTLMNEEEVFTGEQRRRLREARTSDETVAIIQPREAGRNSSRPNQKSLTWIYEAENVRDFAWAASQAFILDASSWEDVLIMSAYPHEGLGDAANPGWERSTEYVRHAVAHYSDTWSRYPYPVAINVAGIVGGMEYPMIVFCDVNDRGQDLFGVTDHEIAHTWFPMMVGSDERRHAWMDEGFTTFINYYSNLTFYGRQAERLGRYTPQRTAGRMQEPIADQPIFTNPDQIRQEGLGFLAYRKPAIGLLLLREFVLGPERFYPAFKAYIDRWAFRHPQPSDFFRTIEDVAGEDLDWFWRGWFMGTGTLDQALVSLQAATPGHHVAVEQAGPLIMPVDLEIAYANGTSERRRLPVELFFKSDRVTLDLPDSPAIRAIVLDPDHVLPDVNRTNNRWRP